MDGCLYVPRLVVGCRSLVVVAPFEDFRRHHLWLCNVPARVVSWEEIFRSALVAGELSQGWCRTSKRVQREGANALTVTRARQSLPWNGWVINAWQFKAVTYIQRRPKVFPFTRMLHPVPLRSKYLAGLPWLSSRRDPRHHLRRVRNMHVYVACRF